VKRFLQHAAGIKVCARILDVAAALFRERGFAGIGVSDLMKAADGFRNLGQFVAAVNVSNNLDIPFTRLKTQMVEENLSLGQAIQKLKPTATATGNGAASSSA